jgi:hypothetical protein
MARAPRNADLPGMEERAIKPLEEIAAQYADIRDRRMALSEEEVALKTKAIQLMHKHKKTEYRHDGIEILLVTGDETVKVKVKKPEADDDPGDE